MMATGSAAAGLVARIGALVSLLGAPGFAAAEKFIDLGIHGTNVEAKIANQERARDTDAGLHLGLGVRRPLPGGNDIGVRVELDEVDSKLLLSIRAIDYRFHVSERLAVGVFLGAARYDLATPAYGYYFGSGLVMKGLARQWDLEVNIRYGDKVARDNVLPTDPQGGSSDNFYDLGGLSLSLSRRF